jgi:hypothetical protein
MTAVRTDLTAMSYVSTALDHVAPGGSTCRTPVLVLRTGLRSLRRPGAASAQPGQRCGTSSRRHGPVRRPRGGRLTRDGPSTARAGVVAAPVLDLFPGHGSAVNASSHCVPTRPSESPRCRPEHERLVMRQFRDDIATTLRDRAVSDMSPGESATMIIPVQVCVQRWLLPPSGGHPQASQASTPAPTD